MSNRKPIIGLAGGVGAGKTTVAKMLEALGAAVIDADQLTREVHAESDVVETLKRWWGGRVIANDGTLDREAAARVVFGDPDERRRLEGLLHPRIAQRRDALIATYRDAPDVWAIVLDAPLLYEVGLNEKCDAVVFVEADPSVRLERVARERGWSREQWARREEAQKVLDSKRAEADYRVDNNSDRESLRKQVNRFFPRIISADVRPSGEGA